MSYKMTVEFKFDIGDIVYWRMANHDHGRFPQQMIVYEQLAQRCHADAQQLYRVGGVDKWISETLLSADAPPMRIYSDESIAEELRIENIKRDIWRRENKIH